MGIFKNMGSMGWDWETYGLYIAVAAIAGFLSWLSFVDTKSAGCKDGRLAPFIAATLVLIFFKGLCVSAIDIRIGYYLDFQSATSFRTFRDQSLEPLYQILNVVIRNITPDYGVFLIVVASITIVPVCFVIWKCRFHINVPFAVMGYAMVFLVTGMSAARQFIAVSFVLLATYYWVIGNKRIAVLWVICALGFHVSALIAVVLFVLISFQNRIEMQAVVSAALVMIALFGRALIETLFTGRYAGYGVFGDVSFGVAVVLKYLPLLALMLFVYKKDPVKSIELPGGQSPVLGLCCSVLFFSIALCLTGYIVSIFGRVENYSVSLIIMIAYLVRRCEECRYFRLPIKGLLLFYFLFRFTLYMDDCYLSETLMPYVASIDL